MTPSLARFFVNLTSGWLNRVLIALIILFVFTGAIIYFISGQRTQSSLIEQLLHRQQLSARAGAASIESFLELSGKSLVILSRRSAIISLSPDAQNILDQFISEWEKTPIVEIILINANGEVLFVANKQDSGMKPGVSVSDRDYFKAAKVASAGSIFVGKPLSPRLGAFEGQYLVPMATPVIKNDKFSGVLGVGILLSEVAESYLEPLKVTDKTSVYLINSESRFIYSPIPELTDKNIFEYLAENPFPASNILVARLKKEFEEAQEKGEGKLDFIRNDFYEKTKLKRILLAYSVINFGERHWILAVETPASEALVFIGPFYAIQNIRFVFGLLIVLVLALLFVLAVRVAQRDAYLDGFAAGRDHEDKLKDKQSLPLRGKSEKLKI